MIGISMSDKRAIIDMNPDETERVQKEAARISAHLMTLRNQDKPGDRFEYAMVVLVPCSSPNTPAPPGERLVRCLVVSSLSNRNDALRALEQGHSSLREDNDGNWGKLNNVRTPDPTKH
jgi:hypothetical protein